MKPQAPAIAPDGPQSYGGHWEGGASGHSLKDLARAVKNRAKYCRKELKRCQRKCSEKAIHKSRVEARRLLSSLDLLGELISPPHLRKAQRALKRHLDCLDDLRDTQVQLLVVGKMLRVFPAARPFYEYLLKREERLGRKTRKRVKRLRHQRLGRLIGACRRDIRAHLEERPTQPAAAVLLRSVDRAFSRTKQRRERIRPDDARSIHRTRVAFKKFRYMVEALADFLPGVGEDQLMAMGHYQRMMGEIQDADVLLSTLDKFLRKQEITAESVQRFREELVRRRQWLIQVYLGAAGQLLQFWPLAESREGSAAVRRRGQLRKHR
jgi:CHAD domain-containing protein